MNLNPANAKGNDALPRPRLLTMEEAAAVLTISESWLRKKVAARAVPFTKIGKQVRFTQAHIDAIIAAGEQQPKVAERERSTARSRL